MAGSLEIDIGTVSACQVLDHRDGASKAGIRASVRPARTPKSWRPEPVT
jgi:hypothetical protein